MADKENKIDKETLAQALSEVFSNESTTEKFENDEKKEFEREVKESLYYIRKYAEENTEDKGEKKRDEFIEKMAQKIGEYVNIKSSPSESKEEKKKSKTEPSKTETTEEQPMQGGTIEWMMKLKNTLMEWGTDSETIKKGIDTFMHGVNSIIVSTLGLMLGIALIGSIMTLESFGFFILTLTTLTAAVYIISKISKDVDTEGLNKFTFSMIEFTVAILAMTASFYLIDKINLSLESVGKMFLVVGVVTLLSILLGILGELLSPLAAGVAAFGVLSTILALSFLGFSAVLLSFELNIIILNKIASLPLEGVKAGIETIGTFIIMVSKDVLYNVIVNLPFIIGGIIGLAFLGVVLIELFIISTLTIVTSAILSMLNPENVKTSFGNLFSSINYIIGEIGQYSSPNMMGKILASILTMTLIIVLGLELIVVSLELLAISSIGASLKINDMKNVLDVLSDMIHTLNDNEKFGLAKVGKASLILGMISMALLPFAGVLKILDDVKKGKDNLIEMVNSIVNDVVPRIEKLGEDENFNKLKKGEKLFESIIKMFNPITEFGKTAIALSEIDNLNSIFENLVNGVMVFITNMQTRIGELESLTKKEGGGFLGIGGKSSLDVIKQVFDALSDSVLSAKTVEGFDRLSSVNFSGISKGLNEFITSLQSIGKVDIKSTTEFFKTLNSLDLSHLPESKTFNYKFNIDVSNDNLKILSQMEQLINMKELKLSVSSNIIDNETKNTFNIIAKNTGATVNILSDIHKAITEGIPLNGGGVNRSNTEPTIVTTQK